MSLHEQIKNNIKEAMKAGDKVRLEVMRGLVTSFTNELVSKSRTPQDLLTDEEALAVITRLSKQRKDSIDQFTKGGRLDLVEEESKQLAILNEYLPKLMEQSEVEEFVKATGVDSLAISIGTSHGAHKFKPGDNPTLKLDILAEVERRIPGFPIVLHGSSSVPKKYVDMIKEFGGELKDAIGIPDEQLRGAAKSAVAKINVDTDGRLAFTAGIRKVFGTNPKEFDPRKYLGPAREEMKAYYKTKMVTVFGSEGAYTKASK
jgi:uncharacterized protein YqeY